jgi:hypothetical protein
MGFWEQKSVSFKMLMLDSGGRIADFVFLRSIVLEASFCARFRYAEPPV